MRYTENRHGKWIIPKKHLQAAMEKLARFEDAEELEDVRAYCLQLRRVADLKKKKEPELYSLLRMAADEIVNMSDFRDSQAFKLLVKRQENKKELLDFLDEIDGQLIDDPVSLIRQKIEEILK